METTTWKIVMREDGREKEVLVEVHEWVDEPETILETLAEQLKEEHGFDYWAEYNKGDGSPVLSEWETDYFEDGTILIDNKPVVFDAVPTGMFRVVAHTYYKNEMPYCFIDEVYESEEEANLRKASVEKQRFVPSYFGDADLGGTIGENGWVDVAVVPLFAQRRRRAWRQEEINHEKLMKELCG
jgi:hypothetical protein